MSVNLTGLRTTDKIIHLSNYFGHYAGVVTRRSVYSTRKWINKYGGTWKLRVSIIKIFYVYICVNLIPTEVEFLQNNKIFNTCNVCNFIAIKVEYLQIDKIIKTVMFVI